MRVVQKWHSGSGTRRHNTSVTKKKKEKKNLNARTDRHDVMVEFVASKGAQQNRNLLLWLALGGNKMLLLYKNAFKTLTNSIQLHVYGLLPPPNLIRTMHEAL